MSSHNSLLMYQNFKTIPMHTVSQNST